jgi:hypothetical protein
LIVKGRVVRRRERPPVAEQGRSPRYEAGVVTTPRPVAARTAVILWCVQGLLAGAYVVVLLVRCANPSFPRWAEPPALLFFSLSAYWLGDRARIRAYPSLRQKITAIVTLTLATIWVFVVATQAIELSTSAPVVYSVVGAAGFAMIMGAAISCYRARYFFWKTSDAPQQTSTGTGSESRHWNGNES